MGCDQRTTDGRISKHVSIHAPRVGCDVLLPIGWEPYLEVSIHAPRVGCDLTRSQNSKLEISFNSRTPCGVRLVAPSVHCEAVHVSIHAPRVGCDVCTLPRPLSSAKFQFTHPVWGATTTWEPLAQLREVSIHAPRVGCDILYASHLHLGL